MSSPTEPLERPRYWLHLLLLALTALSTTWAGTVFSHPGASTAGLVGLLADGLPFSVSLLGILATHEMGHYVLARIHRVDASLPYFIPMPFGLVGTMGAVIRMRDRVRNRNALIDIGAAGPIAGLLVAIPVLAYGIHLSEVRPTAPGMLEGNSLLYLALKYALKGQWLPGNGLDVNLHPVAWAGWVGLLVTMINLLPIGQLDGGHIAFAYFGARHNQASARLHGMLLPLALGASGYAIYELSHKAPLAAAARLGATAGLPWLVWWGLLKLMRRMSGGDYHPPVDDDQALSPARRRLALAMMVVFVLILIPIPLRVTL